jgi:hypothetical protein
LLTESPVATVTAVVVDESRSALSRIESNYHSVMNLHIGSHVAISQTTEGTAMKTLALALVILAMPVAAQAASHHHYRHLSHAARGAYASQPQIACTQVGCVPVPPGCHVDTGRNLNGDPTGFDIANCGRYDMYGHR